MTTALIDYFGLENKYQEYVSVETKDSQTKEGYFLLDGNILCFGKTNVEFAANEPLQAVRNITKLVQPNGQSITLPFDPDEVADNLRLEKYAKTHSGKIDQSNSDSLIRRAYYFIRPFMPVAIRKHLQARYLRGWDMIPFPQWPVDCTVDRLMEWLLRQIVSSEGSVPFIWFWPDGYQNCAIMTHDVETERGRDFCSKLMDIDESYGIRSSFQFIPEKRYEVPSSFLDVVRKRGFEVNIHDLNHDGHLYSSLKMFMNRIGKINGYGQSFGAEGFRSAVMYRNLDWYKSLAFSYDMSVPNTAHLDPQRGGCCTVMPYSIGDIIELPLTTIQDYPLFHILQCYSIDLWKKQIDIIQAHHGLISFNIHPDYMNSEQSLRVYRDLLLHISELRNRGESWFALPGEVAKWWRDRSRMRLTKINGELRIEGEGSEHARIAYASLHGDGMILQM